MTYYIFFIFSLLAMLPGKRGTSDPECSKIKDGHFYYYAKEGSELVKVSRMDSIQVELRPNGEELRNRVIWKSDCSFDLFINAYSKIKLSYKDSILATIPVNIEIKSVEKEYYTCLCTMNIFGDTIEILDTLYFDRSMSSTMHNTHPNRYYFRGL